jgi:hypothetical protein
VIYETHPDYFLYIYIVLLIIGYWFIIFVLSVTQKGLDRTLSLHDRNRALETVLENILEHFDLAGNSYTVDVVNNSAEEPVTMLVTDDLAADLDKAQDVLYGTDDDEVEE